MRASGCNLRCWFCDTPYASWDPVGEDLSVEEILQQVEELACSHVVLTGGEPLLFAEMIPLCNGLRQRECHITIETAGTLYLPLKCDLMSISPKMSNSTPSQSRSPKWHLRHQQTRHVPEVIERLISEAPYQIKFVIASPADCVEVERYLQEFPAIDSERVLLMPQATDEETSTQISAWLEPYCQENGRKFCPRMQIQWFGLVRGT